MLVSVCLAALTPSFAADQPRAARPKCSVQLTELDTSLLVTVELPDLDGDGRKDYSIQLGCGATGSCERLIVVTNGPRCPRLVAELFGGRPVRLDSKQNGFRDFAIFGSGGCAGTAGVLQRYAYNGENYVAVEMIQCHCPGEEPSEATRDSRCDTWRPR